MKQTVSFEALGEVHLRAGGGGGDPKNGLCVMELVDFLTGADKPSDRPRAACPVLTEFAIALNDSAPTARRRDTLKPLAVLMIGTRDPDLAWARAEHLTRAVATRVIAHVDELAARRALCEIEELRGPAQGPLLMMKLMAHLHPCLRRRRRAADSDRLPSRAERWRMLREILLEAILLDAANGQGDARRAAPMKQAA